MARFCGNCGTKLPDDALFCEVCGTRVPDAPSPSTSEAETPNQQAAPAPDQGFSQQSIYSPHHQPEYYKAGNAPQPQKPAGGLPKGALIGGAVLVVAAAAAFLTLGKGGKGKTEPGASPQAVAAAPANSGNQTGGSGQVSGGAGAGAAGGAGSGAAGGAASGGSAAESVFNAMSESEQAEVLNNAINTLTGGGADASQIKIPEGAVVKTDAQFTDLIGEYEGEIQLTDFSGMEKIDGAPANIAELQKQAVSAPLKCELEIDEDGQWEIEWDFMNGMNFESREYDDPEELTPQEIQALMIPQPSNGAYHSTVAFSGEMDDGQKGSMKMDHTGVYCTMGDDRLIAGRFSMQASMFGTEILVAGDFVVHKTSEEFIQEETPPSAAGGQGAPSTVAGGQGAPSTVSGGQDAPSTVSGGQGAPSTVSGGQGTPQAMSGSQGSTGGASGGIDPSSLGRKAEALAGRQSRESGSGTGGSAGSAGSGLSGAAAGAQSSSREIGTVSGGKWIEVAATWFYQKDGKIVKNSWVDDNGVFYYVDENGYMLEDDYTPDGYYVGPDGSYNPKDPKNAGVSGGGGSSGGGSSFGSTNGNSGSFNNNLLGGLDSYDPSTFAITDGEWEPLQDGSFMYFSKAGVEVRDTWVGDRGKYYYIGPDGTMIRDNYSADGFWVGNDGSWDRSVPQRQSDPEPRTGTYEGYVSTWKVKITKDGTYGTATFTYTAFGGQPVVYTLMPLGHGCYLAEDTIDSDFKALMSISENGRTLTVSQAGITEVCTLK